MASDKHAESHHRKHRRSSSSEDEAGKSSKRHKHRHHKHHHRHHRDKKHKDEIQFGGDEIVPEVASPPPLAAPVGVSNGGDDEVEEGEILEEEGLGEILKKRSESDGESGEFKTGQFRDDNLSIHDDIHPVDGHVDDSHHEKTVHQGKQGSFNGDLAHESERDDTRWHRGSRSPSRRGGKKSYDNSYVGELDGIRVSDDRSSFSSEGSEEKYKIITRSPSKSRYTNEVRARSRSRTHDQGKEISQSHSVMEEEIDDRRHRDSSRSRRYDTIDSGRNDDKDYRYGRYEKEDRHHSREVLERGRSREREIDREEYKRNRGQERSRHREIDCDWRREREREKRRELEADHERRKEKERDHDLDRERRWERDHVWDRDRTRYSSREREREKEKERWTDKERDRGKEIQSNREKRKSHDDGSDDIRPKEARRSRNGAENDLDILKRNSLKAYSSKGATSAETRGKLQKDRDEDEQNDNEEGVVWELPEQEEEELNRIKEESRKRRQAILDKYKKQQSQQQSENSSHDKGKDFKPGSTPDQSSNIALSVVRESDAPDSAASANVAAANVGQAEDAASAVSADGAKPLLMVGKSSPQHVIPDSERKLAPAELGEGTPKSEGLDDMFRDDIFGESPAGTRKAGHLLSKGDGIPIVRSGLHDNWDDAEGYYSYQFGELFDGRYEVLAAHGKGVFSTVVRAKDLKAGPEELTEVAIKIIRNNETMHKAGQTEVLILKKLAGADPENRRHCVRFLSSFKYRNHLCIVFESLHLNLREVLKKFGRNIGLKLTAVRVYAKQLFIALKHLKNCGVLHCDIKPDNMLVNEAKNVLKLCDFGNAMFAGKNEVTPYLVSRFYRAPEIILGLPYDHPLDIWSVGCCLYELYSGKVLFPGPTNNDMLRLHMELKGPFPKKMLRKGAFTNQHFDQDLNFHATEDDPVTGKTIKRMIVNIKPKDIGSIMKGYSGEDPKMLAHFKDLLDKIFVLDPERRLTVSQALAHPFVTGK